MASAPAAGKRSQLDWLLLIPTRFEQEQLKDLERQIPRRTLIEICGFGLAVSGAKTSQLLHQHRPKNVMLMGISGHYDSSLEIGQAVVFSEVACYGIGVGTGKQFVSAEQMGWKQWDDHESMAIGDRIRLDHDSSIRKMLLSVAAASNDHDDVAQRRTLFPEAIAEDMEGFSVAAACRLAGVPLQIVRGISNQAGVRDKSLWRIGEAMQAAWNVGRELIVNRPSQSV